MRKLDNDDDDDTQVYKRPWVGLTDEEHNAIYNQCQGVRVGSAISLTEAKLKEKNT